MSAIQLVAPFVLTAALAACASSSGVASPGAPDPANATYQIARDTVTLASGRAERDAAPGSASKIVTTLSDKRATGDVDGAGRPDAVAVLVHQPGGSGTFYYIAALLNGASGPTPVVLLGDRVVVTAVRLDGRTVVVELLDHASGQPLAASPTVTVTKRFAIEQGALVAR